MTHVVTHPIIEANKAEINEAIELQRAHFPNDDEAMLRYRAEQFRQYRYEKGRWPRFAAVAKREAAERAAREAAEKAAAEAAAARAAEGQGDDGATPASYQADMEETGAGAKKETDSAPLSTEIQFNR